MDQHTEGRAVPLDEVEVHVVDAVGEEGIGVADEQEAVVEQPRGSLPAERRRPQGQLVGVGEGIHVLGDELKGSILGGTAVAVQAQDHSGGTEGAGAGDHQADGLAQGVRPEVGDVAAVGGVFAEGDGGGGVYGKARKHDVVPFHI